MNSPNIFAKLVRRFYHEQTRSARAKKDCHLRMDWGLHKMEYEGDLYLHDHEATGFRGRWK